MNGLAIMHAFMVPRRWIPERHQQMFHWNISTFTRQLGRKYRTKTSMVVGWWNEFGDPPTFLAPPWDSHSWFWVKRLPWNLGQTLTSAQRSRIVFIFYSAITNNTINIAYIHFSIQYDRKGIGRSIMLIHAYPTFWLILQIDICKTVDIPISFSSTCCPN